jgi:hypothetical protein
MIHGYCLCNNIKVTLKGEFLYLYNCHCEQCRAFSGSSHATNASVQATDLEISDPKNSLTEYKTNGGKRHFCKNCGSPIYSYAYGGEEFPALHVGIIAAPPEKALDTNIWISEKCPWVKIPENLPNFEKALD